MKLLSLYVFLLLTAFTCMQQLNAQSTTIDSMEKELKRSANDSTGVFLVLQLADRCWLYDSAKASRYLADGYKMVKRLNWDYAYGFYYEHRAKLRQKVMDETHALLLYDSAIEYYGRSANAKRDKKERADAFLSIANCKGEKGELLVTKGEYKQAIAEYIPALEAWKNSGNDKKDQAVAVYYGKISTVYYKLNQIDKALEYDKLALPLIEKSYDEEDAANALIFICDDFIRLHQLDSSLFYLSKAKPIVEKLNNYRLNIQYYNKLGSISRQKKNYKDAIGYFNKTLAIARLDKDQYQVVAAQKIIGLCYGQMQDYITARNYLVPALEGAMQKNYPDEKIEILQELVKVEKNTNHQSMAFLYLEQLSFLKDSSTNSSTKKSIAEIENKYQASEKEKKIIRLENDRRIQDLSIQKQSTLNYFLIASIAALLSIGFLGYRNFYTRHLLAKKETELHQKQIDELEKDRQLIAVDCMLKGQEDERSRLAKDLHDGLGGLLSGVKFSLRNMKDNLVITPDNMAVFERSLDMLDTSIRELRRVAQNMTPEMLTKFGLDEALKEYCSTINATGLLNVKYQSLGMDARLDQSVEIIIFRIIQELLNNIMKHAQATEAFVQLIRENSRLNIVVEDNGKGFDAALTENSNGAGWMNIRSRVDYLKGQLDIHTGTGKGTLVNIEFKI